MKVKRKLEKHIVFTHPTFTLLFLQFDPVQFCDFLKFLIFFFFFYIYIFTWSQRRGTTSS